MERTRAKLTDEFPPDVKPVHAGRYATSRHKGTHPSRTVMTYFVNGMWSWPNGELCVSQGRYWRGLAKEAK